MIAAYQRISRADGDLGKDGKDKSNSIKNQKELIQRYISHKESLQNLPVMDFVDDGYTGSNFDKNRNARDFCSIFDTDNVFTATVDFCGEGFLRQIRF